MPSYYTTVNGTKVDRALWEAALRAVEGRGDGRISRADAETIVERVLDASPGQPEAITGVEQATIRLIRATMRWTPSAERRLRSALAGAGGKGQGEAPTTEPPIGDEPSTTEPPTSAPPTPPQRGTVSELFPAHSRFDRVDYGPHIPANADRGDIEEDAHVLSYTTADGQHYCELWWAGGDSGTPLLAFLVDDDGPHYLPELSEPKLAADPPFASLEEARDRFIALAEAFYAGRPDSDGAGTGDLDAVIQGALARAGLPRLGVSISAAAVREQERAHGGRVSFGEALGLALQCWLDDASRSESPLQLVQALIDNDGSVNGMTDAKVALRSFIDRSDSALSMLEAADFEAGAEDRDGYTSPPHDGETLAPSWLFHLYLPALSDHAYWAVIDRSGQRAPYCYGRN